MKQNLSPTFFLLAILFIVCLICSNLFASKIAVLLHLNLPAAIIIFPITYILNDCLVEVYGYKKAVLVIWTAFLMNLFVVISSTIAMWLPSASFWNESEKFNYLFTNSPKILIASFSAFLMGSFVNAFILSKMKIRDRGNFFSKRAIISSILGDLIDSMIFLPIVFWHLGFKAIGLMVLSQVCFKLIYEIIALPLTSSIIKKLKKKEGMDVYDNNISYNPFLIFFADKENYSQ